MRYEKEDIIDEQFPEGYGHSPFTHPLGFDAPNYSASPREEEYEGPNYSLIDDEEEELENEPSPEPWEEQVRLWGMYPGE